MICVDLYNGPFAIIASNIAGTGTMLLTKYVLDKKRLFFHRSKSHFHEGKPLVLYEAMELATTVIFWSMEALFQCLFRSPAMRYTGGFLGLVNDYHVKHQLDLRHFFRITPHKNCGAEQPESSR